MPKLGLALSAAGAGPLRMPAGNLAPMGMPIGSGSGSGSGSSGAGIGEFLYSDGNILKMWLRSIPDSNGNPMFGVFWPEAQDKIKFWVDGNSGIVGSSTSEATSPIAVPESVTVSGAVVSNPGGYELPVNGTYTRNGSSNGKPVYEKSSGNGGVLRLFWAGAWFIYYNNQVLNENAILYAQNSVLSPPSGSFNSAGNSPSVTGGTYSGTVTVTWSPAHASFDGTQYLTIPNPLVGSTSADMFAVVKAELYDGNGPVIGNIGVAQQPEKYLLNNDLITARFSLFRAIPTNIFPSANPSKYASWHLLQIHDGPLEQYVVRLNEEIWLQTDRSTNFSAPYIPQAGAIMGPFIGRSAGVEGDSVYENYYFRGKIAEIMLYNRALTPSERTVVQNYLNQKYSLWV